MSIAPLYRFALLPLLGLLLAACSEDKQATSPVEPTVAALGLPQEAPETRLPEGIAPTHYRLQLTIDPRQEDFSGSVEIDIELEGVSSLIWLHGKSFDVSRAEALLTAHNGRAVPVARGTVRGDQAGSA